LLAVIDGDHHDDPWFRSRTGSKPIPIGTAF
jgi:hypothetical protein